MELRALAEAIVFGETLEEKLLQPGTLRDQRPGPALERVPSLPGRVATLRPSDERLEPPPLSGLHDPGARARVLHSFANHELQALELQALALLRFPDAPASFRDEIARVLVEEQGHLRLYLERCRDLGWDLGDAGLSRYLWDSLASMRHPLEYVTGMALTFEQANLDFARDYEARFRAVGDEESAAILVRVYEEEIGHVQLGVQWLKHWAPDEDDWTAYRRLLPPSLTPRRARGTGRFQREARLAAGLSERFVAELEVSGGSRGRPPDLLWFRPGAERALQPHAGPQTPPRSHSLLAADLSATLALAARDDDLILVPQLPGLAWRRSLVELGLPQVEWVVLPDANRGIPAAIRDALGERGLGRLRPWAWDPLARAYLSSFGAPPLDASELALLMTKPWAAERLDALVEAEPGWGPLLVAERGETCPDCGATERALISTREGWRVAKAPLASSGEGLRRLAPGEAPDANFRAWAERALVGGPLRVEPWHERVADLSLVFEVGAEGKVGEAALTAFRCDARGRYRGHWIGPARRFLEPAALRLLHEVREDAGGANGLAVLERCASDVAAGLAEAGYRGPAGIDALIAKEGEGVRLHPLLEVNVRSTFGHLARGLSEKLRRGRVGLWELVPERVWRAAGHETAAAFAASLPRPISADGGLAGGALTTNDPSQAKVVLGILSVAPTPLEAEAILARALKRKKPTPEA